MKIRYIAPIVLLFACGAVPRLATASVVYTYTGNPYDRFVTLGTPPPDPYDLSMSVSANFVLDEPVGPNQSMFLTPTSWSMFDGTITLDSSMPTTFIFSLGTDASGEITSWNFFGTSDPVVDFGETYHQIGSVFGAAPGLGEADFGSTANCIEFNSAGRCSNLNRVTYFADSPGTWTVSPVPLPGAAWLFGSALLASGAWRRRRGA